MTATRLRIRALRIRAKGLRSTNLQMMRRARRIAERFEAWADTIGETPS